MDRHKFFLVIDRFLVTSCKLLKMRAGKKFRESISLTNFFPYRKFPGAENANHNRQSIRTMLVSDPSFQSAGPFCAGNPGNSISAQLCTLLWNILLCTLSLHGSQSGESHCLLLYERKLSGNGSSSSLCVFLYINVIISYSSTYGEWPLGTCHESKVATQ